MFGFDKTFFRFLWGFLGILLISLVLILLAGAYKKGGQEIPVTGEEQTAH